MKTKVLENGQIALPVSIRRELGLRPGDSLDVRVEGRRVLLTPRRTRLWKARIVADPITGLPVLSAGPGAPVLTSEQVEEILYGGA
jgi:AbrB family looped-hinge helix DNA binding protein